MLTCLKCLKTTEPQVIVVERSNRYPLCDKCGVSMVDLIERMPLDVTSEVYELSQEEQDHDMEMKEAADKGELTEVKPKAKAKKKKSK